MSNISKKEENLVKEVKKIGSKYVRKHTEVLDYVYYGDKVKLWADTDIDWIGKGTISVMKDNEKVKYPGPTSTKNSENGIVFRIEATFLEQDVCRPIAVMWDVPILLNTEYGYLYAFDQKSSYGNVGFRKSSPTDKRAHWRIQQYPKLSSYPDSKLVVWQNVFMLTSDYYGNLFICNGKFGAKTSNIKTPIPISLFNTNQNFCTSNNGPIPFVFYPSDISKFPMLRICDDCKKNYPCIKRKRYNVTFRYCRKNGVKGAVFYRPLIQNENGKIICNCDPCPLKIESKCLKDSECGIDEKCYKGQCYKIKE